MSIGSGLLWLFLAGVILMSIAIVGDQSSDSDYDEEEDDDFYYGDEIEDDFYDVDDD